ncbi:hypothetical protein NLJ89_g808 [Agrocybe chaxingu]|uniref:Uncharacterized protein n=1 Tax=Agrocybe chaxingu TaxID=84603 RepID=A0A9W8N140_9AGAR|nr:hypothetical protein NLJ89_g808 [Agrocybe chaxingu]
MPHYEPQDDVFTSNSHFLSPAMATTKKSPSRQSLSARRSTASLRSPSSLSHVIEDDASGGRQHSLAHELAVALMPEPSAGSRLLAEEFGIEYDEGAEGIDNEPNQHHQLNGEILGPETDVPSLASELGTSASDASFHDLPSEADEPPQEHEIEFNFGSPVSPKKRPQQKVPELDPMEVLAHDLESTDKFLSHLRSIDIDHGASVSQQPTLEKLASDVIRRINDTARDREGQVRELLEYEREFRKIAGEVGGGDVLSQLDELAHIEDLSDRHPAQETSKLENRRLDVVEEEPKSPVGKISHAADWELDPDKHHLGDEDEDPSEPATSPIKDSFPPPPSMHGPATPASTVPQLTHIRTFTTSLISSLTTISEQAQVNGAATTEAGRKIRALKNKLGGWRTDWDSAERSRLRIEKWEAGITDGENIEGDVIPTSPGRQVAKRVDGRKIAQEHIDAFTLALQDASTQTQAIMARIR